jgi:methionine biosynthesis protein MetW
VLDLGSGNGAFLERLVQVRRIVGEGVEKNRELAAQCIQRGLVVHQGDILDGLDQYGLECFDYVLLLGTFQELVSPEHVLREAFRVGRRVITSYSNFAHIRVRWQILLGGRTPITQALPNPWYRTANLHFFSILDFQEFCRATGVREVRSAYFNRRGRVTLLPNLRADEGVSLLEREPVK